MDAERSEVLFATYLKLNNIEFERHYHVNDLKNVDFKIDTKRGTVLGDVKEVHDSRDGIEGTVNAYTHIREDLKDLRKKFGRKKPAYPVVLITMNFSSKFFTAYTVVHAMLGDVGAMFVGDKRGKIYHLPRGNASMTKTTNTSISGVFVYDCVCGNHTYFHNEFATIKVPNGYFPDAKELDMKKSSKEEEMIKLTKFMFWEMR